MKKTLLALAVLGAFAGTASAQSSVTLSGMVDAGIKRQGTATGNDWSFGGSQSGYNNFTLSGNEDLGGGMKAFFSLNHRFNIANGANNSPTNGPANGDVFWRQALVGLGGGFGDVRLGRFLTFGMTPGSMIARLSRNDCSEPPPCWPDMVSSLPCRRSIMTLRDREPCWPTMPQEPNAGMPTRSGAASPPTTPMRRRRLAI